MKAEEVDLKQGIKNFIAKLPGVRGFLKKWRAALTNIKTLKKQNADLKKQVVALKKKNQTYSKEIKKIKTEKESLDNEVKKLNTSVKNLKEQSAKGCVAADLARLRERYNDRKTEQMFLALCGEKAREMNLTYLDKIDYLEKEKPFVSIIMLNRDGMRNLQVLMPSLKEREFYKNFELICVDNASTDDSVAYLESWKDTFDITIIKNEENMSFSAANNLGAQYAKGDFLLFLNNDTEVTDGWLDELLFAMHDSENPGAVGAKLIYPQIPEGVTNSGKSYTVQHSGIRFKDVMREKAYFIQPYNMGNGTLDTDISYDVQERACVTAAVMLVKKEVFEAVGGYDEKYIYGYEDVDLCLKFYAAGYKNYYCPTCLVYHYEFGTQSKDVAKDVRIRRLHNMNVFKGKWQRYLAEKLYNDKLNGTQLFVKRKLTIGLVVTEAKQDTTAGDFFTAMEFAASIKKLGYQVKYLSRFGKKDWYDVGPEVDVLISLLDAYDISQIYNCKNDIITIAWARNWFERWCEKEYFDAFDMVFASSKTACQYVEEHSNKKAILFPIATNADRFVREEPLKLTEEEKERFTSDYAFTGSYWNVKRDIIDYLNPAEIPYDCKIYGANWEKIDKFKDNAQGFVVYSDMPKIYENTKIVIDDANHVTKAFGAVNSRVFDALAAGDLVLTNGVIGAEETFEGLLPSFDSKEEFNQKLTYYLEHEEERQELVEKLKAFVLEHHTYDARANRLKEILEGYMDDAVNEKEIDICGAMPDNETKKFWGDQHFAVGMKTEFEKLGYQVNILPRDRWYDKSTAKYVIVLRGTKPYYQPVLDGRKYIMWNISHPEDITLEEYNSYDYVFFASEKMCREIGPQLEVPSGVLLQCVDDEVMVYDEKPEKEYELLFIGNSRKIFRPILKDLLPTDYKLSVYGRNWEEFPVYDYVVDDYLDNGKVGQAYHDAKILLNDHWDDMRDNGIISNRIFDALAVGAFVISDEIPELDALFEGNVVTYHDREDLKEKIDYYMTHDEEREKKAKAGQQIVLKAHTFRDRVKDMVEVFDKL